MADRTMLTTRWTEMKGRIREAWGALSDDDLDRLQGRWDQVVAVVRRKTGDTLEAVEAKLDDLIERLREDDEPARR